MTFNVREVALGEVCEIKQGRYLAPNQMEPIPNEECLVPVIGGNGVLGYTDKSTYSYPVPLVTCRGSKCGLMQWAEHPTWISNNAMAVYFKENQGDNFFLHQYLLNSSFDDVITGSAQPQITVSSLSLKRIMLPDLQTQKAISSIMKNIDRKILINEALSRNLESIAQSIFKSWFIDFDPVHAKSRGEKPFGMDDETAELFPDSFEDSELGMIPKGWEFENITNFAQIRFGAPFSSALFNTSGEGNPLIRIRDLKNQATNISTTEAHSKGFLAKPGDLLVGMDGEFTPVVWFGDPSLVNQRICMFEPINQVHNFYLYFNLIPLMKQIEHGAAGTTVIHLSKGELDSISLLQPGSELLDHFKSIVSPICLQMASVMNQNRRLSRLRDLLLPKLISGELQIPEELLVT